MMKSWITKTLRAKVTGAIVPQLAALLAVSLFATACGGGGGGNARDAATGGGAAAAGAAGAAGGGGAPGGGTLLPGADNQGAFQTTVFPLTRQFCATCHAGAGPGFPHISHPDVGTAFRAVIDNQKVNLVTPVNSRLVQRLVADGHFCWSNCAADGAEMEAAITTWAQAVLDPNAPVASSGSGSASAGPSGEIFSATRTLGDAVAAASGRNNANAIAIYEFKAGAGDTAFDTSGVTPTMDLDLQNAEWMSGGGIDFQVEGRAIADEDGSRKLFNRIASGSGTQQFSVEAWVVPANTSQDGPARIVSYSNGTQNRNFTLGQQLYSYNFRNRSMALGIGPNGSPALQTNDDEEDLQARLQHVVVTFDQVNGRRVWVDGAFTDDPDENGPGLLVNWNPDYRFVLGNETSNNREWLGQLKLVAVYEVALDQARIQRNYQAGAAERFTLQMSLDTWLGPGAYIEFEVSEFDAFSYLFCRPTIVVTNPNGFSVQGLRILVNGVAPAASQSFANLTTVVDEPRELLSSQCTVVPKDQGALGDQFQVRFEVLDDNQNLIADPPFPPVVNNDVAEVRPDVGIRDFDQVNNTMARVTGVDPTTPNIEASFDELRQQLPSSSDVRSFVSSQQVAVSKLALEYCDTLVESPALRQDFFGGTFQFGAAVPTAFVDQTQRNLIIAPLVDRMVGLQLASQPTRAQMDPVLNGLIDNLTTGCSAATCDAVRTRTVVKATCAAVLSSAAAHIQ